MVSPDNPRGVRRGRGSRGNWINERAHAAIWEETIEQRRIGQSMRARPKEFTEVQRRHMQKFGRTPRKAWQELYPKFAKGDLSKKQLKELRHASGNRLGVDWENYKAYRKMAKKGAGSLSENEYLRVNRMPGFSLPKKTWSTQKALKNGLIERTSSGMLSLEKRVDELSKREVRLLKDVGFDLPSYREIQRRYR